MKTVILILALLQNIPELYNSANDDFNAGRWSDAAGKYEAVLKEDSKRVPSLFNLAVCYTKLGDTARAIGTYQMLLEEDAGIYEAQVNLAILLDQTGKHEEAGNHYEKALALRPDDTQAEINLGMFYMRENDVEKAYPHLVAASDKGFASEQLFVALSEAEHLRKNEPKSREYLEKAFSANPQNINIRKQLASSYFDDKDYQKAVPLLVGIVNSEPTNVDYLYLLGKSYEQLKAYPQAIAVLERAVRIKSDYFQAYATLGVVFYAQEDWQRAAQALTHVVELRPNEALAHFVLATCLDKLGNAKEAIVQYNEFLELDDGSSDARSFQARERSKTLERRLKR